MIKIKGKVKMTGLFSVLTFKAGPIFWQTAKAPWTSLEVTWENWE